MDSMEKNVQVQSFTWQLKHWLMVIIFLLSAFLYDSYEQNDKLGFRINELQTSYADLLEINSKITADSQPLSEKQEPLVHNYIQKDGDFYFYELPLSKLDEKNNRGTRDLLTIKYMGKDKKRYHIIRSYTDNRKSFITSKCIEPCKVFIQNGRLQSVGDSVFSNVTEDVVSGALKSPTVG